MTNIYSFFKYLVRPFNRSAAARKVSRSLQNAKRAYTSPIL